jgi:DNA replication ATP-dependent helicase Dna2
MEGAILTVDKSQGIDKDCIIFLVQDGPDQSKLIKDMRRINVSLTRSKCKLIIIGSKSHTEKILGGKLVSMLESYRI